MNEFKKEKWELIKKRNKELYIWGLQNGKLDIYDDELIKKLRDIYYGFIPASIILLSNHMSNGHCYDRALLLAQAFIDTKEDVNLLYGTIDSLKYNPNIDYKKNHYSADHCFVERITEEGDHLIYDTSLGFVFEKDLYWKIENPKIRHINNKESIKRYLQEQKNNINNNNKNEMIKTVIDYLEKTYNEPNEMYAKLDENLLEREINIFKEKIGYNNSNEEVKRRIR